MLQEARGEVPAEADLIAEWETPSAASGRKDWWSTAYVYALLRGERIVYVGTTAGSLRDRAGEHRRGNRRDAGKVFDGMRFTVVPLAEACELERRLIEAASPEYNRAGKTRRYVPVRSGCFASPLPPLAPPKRPGRPKKGKE